MTEFLVLHKASRKVVKHETQASYISSFMIARSIHDYIIIKTDEKGDRCLNIKEWNGDVFLLQSQLEVL